MLKIDPNLRPRTLAADSTSIRDLGDELLAYDRQNHRVHVLNATAREIHGWCNGERTVAEIADKLIEEYGIDEETALRDLTATIDRLIQLGLVELGT